jgi:hypothetical protein
MEDKPTVLKIRNRIQSVSRRLARNNAGPSNADRALWGEFAMVIFADATGLSADLQVDPETVLGDLLADLMHWCDVHTRPVDFDLALRHARHNYSEERR